MYLNKFKKLIPVVLALGLVMVNGTATFAAETNGDAVYRKGGGVNFLDHAAIFYSPSGFDHVYEIKGADQGGVVLSTWASFLANEDYIGAYYATEMDSYDRSDILAIASELEADPDLDYVLADIMDIESNVGTYITTDEIQNIRCDGVVEYAYEWNFVEVWGKSDDGTRWGTPSDHDVSVAANKPEHDDLGGDEPWQELSPKVQRGGSGTDWTLLVAK